MKFQEGEKGGILNMKKSRHRNKEKNKLDKQQTNVSLSIQSNINDNEESHPNVYIRDQGSITDLTLKSCKFFTTPKPLGPTERVIFFDLDNTLYSLSSGIATQMKERIELFFTEYLNVPAEEAQVLGRKFYLDYGLAIKGLILNFNINPNDYDRFVDGGLDLSCIGPDEKVKELISNVKARKFIFTNAGLQHGMRVLERLELLTLFDGIIYCDYCENDFPAKPSRLAFERAMRCVGVDLTENCYFIDDSGGNVRTASELGWQSVLLDEEGEYDGKKLPSIGNNRIRNIHEIRNVFPELFDHE